MLSIIMFTKNNHVQINFYIKRSHSLYVSIEGLVYVLWTQAVQRISSKKCLFHRMELCVRLIVHTACSAFLRPQLVRKEEMSR